MALDGLAELILRPVVELALHIAGYLTGYVVVPVFTLGYVMIEPDRKRTNFSSGGRLKRRHDGKFVMEAEMASLCGLVFWAALAVAVYFFRNHA